MINSYNDEDVKLIQINGSQMFGVWRPIVYGRKREWKVGLSSLVLSFT